MVSVVSWWTIGAISGLVFTCATALTIVLGMLVAAGGSVEDSEAMSLREKREAKESHGCGVGNTVDAEPRETSCDNSSALYPHGSGSDGDHRHEQEVTEDNG